MYLVGDTVFRDLSSVAKLCHDHPEQADNQAGTWVCIVWNVCLYLSVQVWKQPKVWQGFVKCCEVNKAVLMCENFCHLY